MGRHYLRSQIEPLFLRTASPHSQLIQLLVCLLKWTWNPSNQQRTWWLTNLKSLKHFRVSCLAKISNGMSSLSSHRSRTFTKEKSISYPIVLNLFINPTYFNYNTSITTILKIFISFILLCSFLFLFDLSRVCAYVRFVRCLKELKVL